MSISPARILIIAGSDSSGGAGIQADIKTVSALGGYAMTAITAITAQNTLGVQEVQALAPALVVQQIHACLDDIGADAVKIGMLCNAEIVAAVAEALAPLDVPIVLDPVMVATSGDRLLDAAAMDALGRFMPSVSLITPNIPEAALLSGLEISNPDEMLLAAKQLQFMSGGVAVLLKGGHLDGEKVQDLLLQEGEAFWFESARLDTPHTHGTGCTLASAVATLGAQGNALPMAVAQARNYVHEAIRTAPGLGQGHGPLNHNI